MNNSATKQMMKETDDINDKTDVGNNLENVREGAGNKIDDLTQKFDTYQEKAKNGISDVVEKVRRNSGAAQEYLSDKAGMLSEYAGSVKDSVKDIDFDQAKQKIIKNVKANPEASLAVAGVLGLLIGFLVGRKSA